MNKSKKTNNNYINNNGNNNNSNNKNDGDIILKVLKGITMNYFIC